MDSQNFMYLAGNPESPVILHVPHAATEIPDIHRIRAAFLLSEIELAAELEAVTDANTDQLAGLAASHARPEPFRFMNRYSRLVIDPERFTDDREELNDRGMGAIYTKTSGGRPLRHHADQTLLRDYYVPYAAAFTAAVDERLEATGRAVILDLHSYPAEALPYELRPEAARPEVCLGTDPDHTPDLLLAAARDAFAGWDIAVNEPFTGTYVPLKHYGREPRVLSIMIELRRDVVAERFTEVAARLGELISNA